MDPFEGLERKGTTTATTDPFEGLQRKDTMQADPFAGLQPSTQVDTPVNDPFEGLEKRDPIFSGLAPTKISEQMSMDEAYQAVPEEYKEMVRPSSFWSKVKNFFTPDMLKTGNLHKIYKDLPEDKRDEIIGRVAEESFEEHLKTINAVAEPIVFGAWGNIKARTFYLPELGMRLAGIEPPVAETTMGKVAEKIGELTGMWTGLGYLSRLKAFWWFDKLKPTTKLGVLGKRMLTGGFRLGTYSALSEHGGKDLMDNLKHRAMAGTGSFALGTLFGAVSSIAYSGQYAPAKFATFAVRLGINQFLIGREAWQRYAKGDESLPGLMYSIGLATMFAASNNPLVVEAQMNKSVQRMHKLKGMTQADLAKEVMRLGDSSKIPADIKWAYIIKATGGKVKPTYQNAGSMDYLFNDLLQKRDPFVYNKLKFVSDIKSEIETQFGKEMEQAIKDRPIVETRTQAGKVSKQADITKKAGYSEHITAIKPGGIQAVSTYSGKNIGKANAIFRDGGKILELEGFAVDREHRGRGVAPRLAIELVNTAIAKYPMIEQIRGDAESLGGYKLAKRLGATFLDPVTLKPISNAQAEQYARYGHPEYKRAAVPWSIKVGTFKSMVDKMRGKPTGKVYIEEPRKPNIKERLGLIKDVVNLRRERHAAQSLMREEIDRGKHGDPMLVEAYKQDIADINNKIKDLDKRYITKKEVSSGYTTIKMGTTVVGEKTYDLVGDDLVLNPTQVHPDHQGKGLEAKLLRTTLNAALKKNKNIRVAQTSAHTMDDLTMYDKFGAKFYDTTGQEVTLPQAQGVITSGQSVDIKIDLRDSAYMNSKAGREMPWLSWIPKDMARAEKQLRVEPSPDGPIPKNKQILPADFFDWVNERANPFNWLQSGRISLGPIYDVYKQGYMDYIKSREARLLQLGNMYVGRVKVGSDIDKKLALFSDGQITIDKIPQEYRELALQRQKFYQDYADTLLERGLIKRNVVYEQKQPYTKKVYHVTTTAGANKIAKSGKLHASEDMTGRTGVFVFTDIRDAQDFLSQYHDGKGKIINVPLTKQEVRQLKLDDSGDMGGSAMWFPGNISIQKTPIEVRRPYYHRLFDGVLNSMYDKGFALEELWLPGSLPLAGPLRTRRGGKDYKLSAVESDMRYVYAVEKYLNLFQPNEVATAYAKLLTPGGMRRDMANTYIRFMRGQPTKTDRYVRESMKHMADWTAGMLDKIGLKSEGEKVRNWQPFTYPVSRITSPIARMYYWRYVGLAMDTSMKNSIQWHHAMAKHGIDNTLKAMYMQHTPEGRRLIEKSRIQEEGIRRGANLMDDGTLTKKIGKIEEASYWLWSRFDSHNRSVSGLAGYYDAIGKGRSHADAIKEMQKTSHETQFGYSKADSLLCDMASPAWRLIMFKKWPLAKVEMVRTWAKEGRHDAIFNLAMTEYMIYRAAQSAGVDLGGYFGGIWTLATRGIEDPISLIPAAKEVLELPKIFAGGAEGRVAKERLIRSWRAGGNRWLGKVWDAWDAWQNDWQVQDLEGRLKYQSTPREVLTGLFFKPQETTERQARIKEMIQLDTKIGDMRRRIMLEMNKGNLDKAMELNENMVDKYGDEYSERYGKVLLPVTMQDAMQFEMTGMTPTEERVRKQMPGRGPRLPVGAEYEGLKKKRKGVIPAIRGY